jgi:hypothetical protein
VGGRAGLMSGLAELSTLSCSRDRDEGMWREPLRRGLAIPAHPLALTSGKKLDERHQRALSRYYIASGAGGLAVGVHTTQFAIHDPSIGLLQPVLALAAEEMDAADASRSEPLVRVTGICGPTPQAVHEARMASDLGYQLGLISLSALKGSSVETLVSHCAAVAEVIDIFGFYLQPEVGGIPLPHSFWRAFCEIERVRAIKVAAFDRYRTSDVVRAVVESGREDIALYTGNDDSIVVDLMTPYRFGSAQSEPRYFVGGLLGQWAVWTSEAVGLLHRCGEQRARGVSPGMLETAARLTDANGAIFDAANGFRGCLSGIYEVLRRQGLLAGTWSLDDETLSAGQSEEIDRVCAAYPELTDDVFVASHLDEWLR